jgi:hypothetical protein
METKTIEEWEQYLYDMRPSELHFQDEICCQQICQLLLFLYPRTWIKIAQRIDELA